MHDLMKTRDHEQLSLRPNQWGMERHSYDLVAFAPAAHSTSRGNTQIPWWYDRRPLYFKKRAASGIHPPFAGAVAF